MLVITRRKHEKVFIETAQGRIVVAVSHIQPGKVQLAFDAPKEIKIAREELTK